MMAHRLDHGDPFNPPEYRADLTYPTSPTQSSNAAAFPPQRRLSTRTLQGPRSLQNRNSLRRSATEYSTASQDRVRISPTSSISEDHYRIAVLDQVPAVPPPIPPRPYSIFGAHHEEELVIITDEDIANNYSLSLGRAPAVSPSPALTHGSGCQCMGCSIVNEGTAYQMDITSLADRMANTMKNVKKLMEQCDKEKQDLTNKVRYSFDRPSKIKWTHFGYLRT